MPTNNQSPDELAKKLQANIEQMFELEFQRNELNFALSGVERGEITHQDIKEDMSLALSNWIVKDLLPEYSAQQKQSWIREARIEEVRTLVKMGVISDHAASLRVALLSTTKPSKPAHTFQDSVDEVRKVQEDNDQFYKEHGHRWYADCDYNCKTNTRKSGQEESS